MYNSQLNPAKTTKNEERYLAYAIVFGTFIVVILGNLYENQVVAIIISIILCMVIGYFLGKKKDKEVNDQLENFAYAVKESSYKKDKDRYRLTIVDKKDREKVIEIKADKYRDMELKKAELVFLKKNGQITPAYNHARKKKHKSAMDATNGYKKVKDEREKNKSKAKENKDR